MHDMPPGDPHERKSAGTRLMFLVTEYYYFRSHKLAVAKHTAKSGFKVSVASRIGDQHPEKDGIMALDVDWARSSSLIKAAIQFFPELFRVRRLLTRTRPDVLHNIALKPVVMGSLASLGTGIKVINSINGFGFVFQDRSFIARVVQKLSGLILRLSAKMNDALIVFQNPDDMNFARDRLRIPQNRLRLIAGSGVDIEHFSPATVPPEPPVTFLVLARLLYIKGIQVAVAAHRKLQQRGVASELLICGGQDSGNPSSISSEDISKWSQTPGIRFLGHQEDVRAAIVQCHVAVHPSLGGEGLPKALLEAAACGKPMIATDIPGNREIVLPQQTGLLVKPNDPDDLADAMEWTVNHPEEMAAWGRAARVKVEADFSLDRICEEHAALYGEFRRIES